MNEYIAIECEEDQGCEGCYFWEIEEVTAGCSIKCNRPDSVPNCQQTDEHENTIEFIYEVKP